MQGKCFWDSNLWVYLLVQNTNPQDSDKKQILENLIWQAAEITVSTQVLNEVANVLMKKFALNETETSLHLKNIMNLTQVIPLSEDITFSALYIKEKYKLSWFDSLIIAAALKNESEILLTEDLQNGLIIRLASN